MFTLHGNKLYEEISYWRVQVMNYTHNHNKKKGSDAASDSEVFAHLVIPYIPEKSSAERNRSTFKVRCN